MGQPRVACITGIAGQDGSYLAELLLQKDYTVHGVIRPGAVLPAASPVAMLQKKFPGRCSLHQAQIEDTPLMERILEEIRPDEIYHLAALSSVAASWENPIRAFEINGMAVVRLLESCRQRLPQVKFFQASSSEMFGRVDREPQDESTPFHPRSPYACAKVFGHYAAAHYRENHGMFVASGILFNHESPRRGQSFVTRKITRGVAEIAAGRADHLSLGNLDAKRDWGHAADYVDAMWRMLQQERPDEFVVATGESHSVGEFAAAAFGVAGLDWKKYVVVDQSFLRPADPAVLVGSAVKAARVLGWKPSISFSELVREMVAADCAFAGVTLPHSSL